MTSPSLHQSFNHKKKITKGEDVIEQLRGQYEILFQSVASSNRLLEELLSRQTGGYKQAYLDKMLVKSNKHLVIIHTDDIDWIEAWGDYIRIHGKGKTHIVRQKICDMETRLDPQKFLRIGRSAIINVNHIKELESLNHGDYLITLHDSTQLNLSRNYRDRLAALFDNHIS